MPTPKRKRHWSSKHQFGRVQDVFSWEGGRECTFPPACRSRGAKAKMWKIKEIPLASSGGMPYIFFWCYISLCENLSVKLMIDSYSMGLERHSSKKDLTFHSSKYNCLDGDASPFKLVERRPRNRWKLPNLYTADLLQTTPITLHSWKVGIPSPLEGSMDSADLRMVLSPHVTA